MPILSMSAGRVTAIRGDAYLRHADGQLTPLKVGDLVKGGTHIVTEDNGLVEILPIPASALLLKNASVPAAVEKTIAGIEALDPSAVPAAGPAGGAQGSLQPGLRVDRVAEATSPAGMYTYAARDDANQGGFGSSADQRELIALPVSRALTEPTEPTGPTEPTEPPEPTGPLMRISDVQINEGAGTAVFTVTLDSPSSETVTVNYATGSQTDTASPGAGADYTAVQGQLVFVPGQTSLTITVPINNDIEPGIFEADPQGEGRESFVVTLSQATQAVIDKGVGVAVIRDDGQGYMPNDGRAPDDDRPLVESVEVLAADPGYLYFGVRVSNASESPIHLSLDVSPGYEASAPDDDTWPGDTWTGGIEYTLDAADGLNEDITFLSWRGAPPVDESSAAVVTLPPLTPPGLIIVKVPIFISADLNAPLVDQVRLEAATQYDTGPKIGAEMSLLHGEVAVNPKGDVTEGGLAIFDVMLANAVNRDITVKLTVSDGDDRPDTPQNEQAIAGVDTDTQLFFRASDAQDWTAVSADGVLLIPQGTKTMQVRVDTKDDALPEDLEFIRLSVSGVDGGVLVTQGGSAQVAIRDNDADFDPVRAQRVDASEVRASAEDGEGIVPLVLADAFHPSTEASHPGFDKDGDPSSASPESPPSPAALDIRDLVGDANDGVHASSPLLAFLDVAAPQSSVQVSQVTPSTHVEHVDRDLGMLSQAHVLSGTSNIAQMLIEQV